MTDKPSAKAKMVADDELEAERRFNETLGRLVNTPHTPHEKKGREPKPAPRKTKGGSDDV